MCGAVIARLAASPMPLVSDWRKRLPTLSGKLVTLRELIFPDARTLYELLSSDPQVTRYTSLPPPSVQAFKGFIAWSRHQRRQGESVAFAVVPHGLKHAVGLFQVRALEPEFFRAEWGFALGSAFWSTGVFEDAAVLVAEFAFGTLHANRLEGRVVSLNGRGNGALQKIGGTTEAVLSRSLGGDGVYHEQLLWALIADEWRRRRAAPRQRHSAAEAKGRVQRAVDEVRTQLRRSAPLNSPWAKEAYPFFITGHPPKRP